MEKFVLNQSFLVLLLICTIAVLVPNTEAVNEDRKPSSSSKKDGKDANTKKATSICPGPWYYVCTYKGDSDIDIEEPSTSMETMHRRLIILEPIVLPGIDSPTEQIEERIEDTNNATSTLTVPAVSENLDDEARGHNSTSDAPPSCIENVNVTVCPGSSGLQNSSTSSAKTQHSPMIQKLIDEFGALSVSIPQTEEFEEINLSNENNTIELAVVVAEPENMIEQENASCCDQIANDYITRFLRVFRQMRGLMLFASCFKPRRT